MQNTPAGKPLPFEACENFRELGGYRGLDGKIVRSGLIYRAPALCNLHTPHDVALFESLGIRHVFDFRSSAERAQQPDPAFAGIEQHNISAITNADGSEVNFDLAEIFAKGKNGVQEMIHSVHEGYAALPFGNRAYVELFRVLCAGQGPVVFHCTAGKDRTGVAAALILTALGVPRGDVMRDYLLTNTCRANGAAQVAAMLEKHLPKEDAAAMAQLAAGVREESLALALDGIAQKYSTFEAYLYAECGVNAQMLAQLRAYCLMEAN